MQVIVMRPGDIGEFILINIKFTFNSAVIKRFSIAKIEEMNK